GGDPAVLVLRVADGAVPGLLPVQVAVAAVQLRLQEPVRDQRAEVLVLHGRHVRACARDLPGREVLPEESGDRAQGDLSGDPGRVVRTGGTGAPGAGGRPLPVRAR